MGGRGGLGSDFEHHHHVVHMGLGRARWHGTQGLPPPFRRPLCPSSRVGFAPISTKSGESRASVWILRSGPSELVDQGQHIEVSAGHVDQLGTLGRGRTRRPGRRSRLPRIRRKALEAPDFVEIGRNNAAQEGRRGPRCGRDGVLVPLAPKNRSRALPCPPVGAFAHRGRPWSTCPA